MSCFFKITGKGFHGHIFTGIYALSFYYSQKGLPKNYDIQKKTCYPKFLQRHSECKDSGYGYYIP